MAEHKHCLIIFFVFIIFPCSAQSRASPPFNSPSHNWAPRFLGKFARQSKPIQQTQPHYETRYFEQRLDHFSFSDLPNFQQRYLLSTEHWTGPQRLGPIFFYCGNEGDIVWFATNTGFVWEIAPQFGAMVVFPEVSIILHLLARSIVSM